MQRISTARRASQIFLWVVPFLPFLNRAYQPGGLKLYAIATAAQALLMAVAVWILAADSIKSPATDRHALLLPGVFLVAGWAFAGLALKMGPPPHTAADYAATLADQQMRYGALLVAGLVTWAGFCLLTAKLREAGERVFSVLALSATTISAAMFSLFTLGALTVYDMWAKQEVALGHAPEWWPPFHLLFISSSALFGVLTYLAASLYAMALGRVGLMGKVGRVGFAILGTIAAALALLAATMVNGPAGPGRLVIFTVPAVPLILPYLIGVNLVRCAGDPAS